jgi:hypothetical protein
LLFVISVLQECMAMLSAACSTQGLTDLGSKLQQFTTSLNINAALANGSSSSSRIGNLGHQQQQHVQQQQQPGVSTSSSSSSSNAALRQGIASTGSHGAAGFAMSRPTGPVHAALLHLLQGLCLQLSRALLPTYSEWLLRFWMGVLLLPGAGALHLHVLLLLRCLFDTPGLRLGPGGAALLLDAAFISPIVNLSQVSCKCCCISSGSCKCLMMSVLILVDPFCCGGCQECVHAAACNGPCNARRARPGYGCAISHASPHIRCSSVTRHALYCCTACLTPLQGPLCQYALDALDAVIHFSANSQELQSYQQQQQQGTPGGSLTAAAAGGMSPLSAGAVAASGGLTQAAAAAAAGPGVDLQGLAACLLPQLDVVELLQRVLDSCAVPAKRRKFKLLPFLSDAAAAGQQAVDQDEC